MDLRSWPTGSFGGVRVRRRASGWQIWTRRLKETATLQRLQAQALYGRGGRVGKPKLKALLLPPERDRGIEPRRAPRGNIDGDGTHKTEQRRHTCKRHGVNGRHLEEQTPRKPPASMATAEPSAIPAIVSAIALTEHEPGNLTWQRSDRDANSDLTRALDDRLTECGEHAERRERQRDQPEQTERPRAESPRRRSPVRRASS